MSLRASLPPALSWQLGGALAAIGAMAIGLAMGLDALLWLGLIGSAVGIGLAWLSLLAPQAEDVSAVAENLPAPSDEIEEARFLSNASHDLRQPIQAISMFAATLAAQPLPEATRKHVDMLEQAACALSDLFEAVILHTKAAAGRLPMAPQPMPLNDSLSRAVGAHLSDAHECGLHLRFVPTRCQAVADPMQLERMLAAMVTHALRTTRSGGVVIGCRRRGAMVCIEIWDSSPGLLDDQVPFALKAFSPAWLTVPDRGLGLATAAVLALQLGGELTLRSRLGKGTVMRLALPGVSKAA